MGSISLQACGPFSVVAGTRLSHRVLSVWLVADLFAYGPHGRAHEINIFVNGAIGDL